MTKAKAKPLLLTSLFMVLFLVSMVSSTSYAKQLETSEQKTTEEAIMVSEETPEISDLPVIRLNSTDLLSDRIQYLKVQNAEETIGEAKSEESESSETEETSENLETERSEESEHTGVYETDSNAETLEEGTSVAEWVKENAAAEETEKTVETEEVQQDEEEVETYTESEEFDEEVNTASETTNSWTATFSLTAYCSCSQCCGSSGGTTTATGTTPTAGRTIAVDPSLIPYGSTVEINGNYYIAEDTGGAIDGYKIDVYFDSHQEALNFGRQTLTCTVYPVS